MYNFKIFLALITLRPISNYQSTRPSLLLDQLLQLPLSSSTLNGRPSDKIQPTRCCSFPAYMSSDDFAFEWHPGLPDDQLAQRQSSTFYTSFSHGSCFGWSTPVGARGFLVHLWLESDIGAKIQNVRIVDFESKFLDLCTGGRASVILLKFWQ